MSRCVYGTDAQFAHGELLSVCGDQGVEAGLGGGSVYDGSAGGAAEIEVSGYEVGVEMGFKYVAQGGAVAAEPLQVGGGFAEGVDDGGFAFGGDVVGPLRQAAGIDLFDDHGWCVCAHKGRWRRAAVG